MEQILFRYLSLSVFPWPINEIDREDLHAQAPLDAIHNYMQAFTVPDYKACVVQFVCHLFEVQVGILQDRQKSTSDISVAFENDLLQKKTNKKTPTISATFSVRYMDRLVYVLTCVLVQN